MHQVNFTLSLKMNTLCFCLNPLRQSLSVLINVGENSCVRLTGGPMKPMSPRLSGAVALNMLQLKTNSQEAGIFKS